MARSYLKLSPDNYDQEKYSYSKDTTKEVQLSHRCRGGGNQSFLREIGNGEFIVLILILAHKISNKHVAPL